MCTTDNDDKRDGTVGDRAVSGSWVDLAEDRLRQLVGGLEGPPPLELGALLEPSARERLRAALRAKLGPALLERRPGRCQIPWRGCPRHGDLMAGGGAGWVCTVAGCRFGIRQPLARLRHCRARAFVVLDDGDGHTLEVCAGHHYSEWDFADYGQPFAVRPIDRRRAA